MSAGDLVVGVDGGSTKTIALVATRDGRVAGAARGAGSNLYAGAADETVAVVAATVTRAAEAAGAELADLAAGGFSMAGADCGEDIAYLRARYEDLGLARQVRVVNDSVGALYAGCPRGSVVAAVCGTGFAASSRSAAGQLWYGGHWTDWGAGRKRGFLGGRAMAEAVVRAVVDQELQLGPPTALTAGVLASFGAATVDEFLHLVTTRGVRHREIRADITHLLLTCANQGDPVALELVGDFGGAMGDFAAVAARKTGIAREAFALVLLGGVLRERCPPLHQALVETVRRSAPRLRVVQPALEPAHGAVLVALDVLGVEPGPGLIGALGSTSPPPAMFITAAHLPWPEPQPPQPQGGSVALHH